MKHITSVPQLDLPSSAPSTVAMVNNNHDARACQPETWEIEYGLRRYLEDATLEELIARWIGLKKALRSYLATGRSDCPINLYHGPWFWFRLEHQARIEFKLRGEALPEDPSAPESVCLEANLPEVFPDGDEVLFRFTKMEHALGFRDKGILRVAPAATYLDEVGNAARQDDEMHKHKRMLKNEVRMETSDGREIIPLGDVTRSISGPRYHQTSFSTVWDDAMFAEFASDACIMIKEPKRLMELGAVDVRDSQIT